VFTGVALETSVLPCDVIAAARRSRIPTLLRDVTASARNVVYRPVLRNKLRNQQWVDMSQYILPFLVVAAPLL
jgi:hypothetical protein